MYKLNRQLSLASFSYVNFEFRDIDWERWSEISLSTTNDSHVRSVHGTFVYSFHSPSDDSHRFWKCSTIRTKIHARTHAAVYGLREHHLCWTLYLSSAGKCYLYGANVYQPSNNQTHRKRYFAVFDFDIILLARSPFLQTFWWYCFVSLFLVAIQYTYWIRGKR